jgi:hypothetical protein
MARGSPEAQVFHPAPRSAEAVIPDFAFASSARIARVLGRAAIAQKSDPQ